MAEKLLSEGGEKAVLADAAKAKQALRRRSRQFPALMLFLAIAAAIAAYNFLS